MNIVLAERIDDRRSQLGEATAPDLDDERVSDAWARAVWSRICEPGDGVAGELIAALGADEALREIRARGSSRRAVRSPALAAGLKRWLPRLDGVAVEGMFRTARLSRLRLLTPVDPGWPRGVDDLGVHAPIVLWLRGAGRATASNVPRVALVGARASTSYGELVAGELSADLAGGGVCIVSGAAFGIDGAAHLAALGAGGETIAVLAGGVDRPYPASHSDLIGRIADTGAVISEIAPGAAPTKSRFLQRNRVIAAMSDVTVVVEAGWRSGSLNTAGHAAALGRPLGAVPGPITSSTSAGCHRLLREFDATCVTSASDIRELIAWSGPVREAGIRSSVSADGPAVGNAGSTPSAEATSPAPPSPGTRVLGALERRVSRSAEEVARRAGITLSEAEANLGLLELEALVQRDDVGWRRAATR